MKGQREISAVPMLAAARNWSDRVSRLKDRTLALKARKDMLPGLAMGAVCYVIVVIRSYLTVTETSQHE